MAEVEVHPPPRGMDSMEELPLPDYPEITDDERFASFLISFLFKFNSTVLNFWSHDCSSQTCPFMYIAGSFSHHFHHPQHSPY